jgi:hypothetical protein
LAFTGVRASWLPSNYEQRARVHDLVALAVPLKERGNCLRRVLQVEAVVLGTFVVVVNVIAYGLLVRLARRGARTRIMN